MNGSHVFKLIVALPYLTTASTGAVVLPNGHFPVVSQTSNTNQSDCPTGYGQTFTVTSAVSIDALALTVRGGSGGADFMIELHRFDPLTSSVESLILGSASVSNSLVGVSDVSWIAASFDKPTFAAAEETFAFVIEHTSGGSGYNRYGNSQPPPTRGGNRLGGYDFPASVWDQVSTTGGTDFAFEIISVPEPTVPGFFSVGISCLYLRRRHRCVHETLPESTSILNVAVICATR